MQRETMQRFADLLRGERALGSDTYVVPASRYRDRDRFERERALIERSPRIVAAASEIAPGACIPLDVPGVSAILARGTDGTLRAFHNACRHRGTRLVDAPCTKAITCPYHAWTYDLAGALIHVPHADRFAPEYRRDLAPVAITERHGLVWLGDSQLDDDLGALALDRHVVWKRSRTTAACNWKLACEAFLDGYHIRILHRDSVYRFFLDAAFVAEQAGPHIRAMTARRALVDAPPGTDPRLLGTPSFHVFPATQIVIHPDFVSIMQMTPLAPNATQWDHAMLVPADRAGETEHWAKSWQLIEDGVFQREDLWVCERAQRAIDAGATDELVFGALEAPVRWFHAALDARL